MGRKTLILWCSAVEIVSMLIIGGLASGPQIAPTVPPKAFGQAAIGFIVRVVFLPIRSLSSRLTFIIRSAYTYSHLTCPGFLLPSNDQRRSLITR
jgi:hypothetical protein